MSYLCAPDTDIIVFLVRAGNLAALTGLGRLPVLVTDMVWEECRTRKNGDGATDPEGRVELLSTWAGAATIVEPATTEAATAAALSQHGDLDSGEISILAWAYHHPDVFPVFHERQALLRALEEMPFRHVLSYHGFLGVLRAAGLSTEAANAISRQYCQRLTWKNAARPTAPRWW